jgi:hypothetical protein
VTTASARQLRANQGACPDAARLESQPALPTAAEHSDGRIRDVSGVTGPNPFGTL